MPNLIKVIHRVQSSILLYIVMGVVAFSMIGFGMSRRMQKASGGSSGRREYAIKIDDHEISYTDFYRYRTNLEEYYRRIYGSYWPQLMQGVNLTQQTIDQLIPGYLLERTAKQFGLHVGPQQVREMIVAQMGGIFDPRMYAALLRRNGMTAPDYERQMADEGVRAQLRQVIEDLSHASKAEAYALLERDETAYDAQYLEFDPAAFVSKVPAPSDDALQSYFQERLASYEKPARISYEFTAFDPKQLVSLVQITEDDVELYYTDHEGDFTTPDRARIQMLRLSIPQEADDAARAELRKKADSLREQAAGGEDFKALVEAYSDDMETKFKGGEIGWINRGQAAPDKAVARAAFELGKPGVTDVVQTPKALYLVNVEEYQPGALKPLTAVRAQIEQSLKEREAPAWVKDRAETLYDQWTKAGKPLADFAKENNLTVERTDGLFEKGRDPEKGFKGLTASVIETPDQEQQLAEAGDKLALVQVLEYKEAEVPPFAELRDQVQKDYVQAKSVELARDGAAALVKDLAEKKYATLQDAGQKLGMELKTSKDMKRSGATTPPFTESSMREALFDTYTPLETPKSSYSAQGKFYVFQVAAVQKPDMSKLQDKIDEYQKRAGQENAQTLIGSLVNELKMRATIDVEPRLSEEK